MSKNDKNRIVQFRRKREGKTNYHKRLSLLKSKMPRLIVRKTTKNMIAQIVMYEPDGDKVIVHVSGNNLKKLGWEFESKNLPSAYLIGYQLGKLAQQKKISDAIVDLGEHISIKKSRLYATIKGVIDSGINVPCSEEAFPDDDRLKGKHIADYFSKNKNELQFSKYKKNNLNVVDIVKVFEEVKKKIDG